MHNRQIFRVDLDHRNIGLLIRADDLRRKFPPVFQFHLDLVGGFHHVKICKDVTVRPDNEPRAFALDGLKISRISLGIIFVRRTLKKQLIKGGAFVAVVLLRYFNDDHARCDDLENLGKCVIELMHHILASLCRRGGNSGCRNDLGLRRKRCTNCRAYNQNG